MGVRFISVYSADISGVGDAEFIKQLTKQFSFHCSPQRENEFEREVLPAYVTEFNIFGTVVLTPSTPLIAEFFSFCY